MIDWHVTALRVLPRYRLEVRFADGLSGIVDISVNDFGGGLFRFTDESYFAQASIQDGVVTWPNGVAAISHALYSEVQYKQQEQSVGDAAKKKRLGFLSGAFNVPDPSTFNDLGKDQIRKMFNEDR
jgi:Protein of unknown function (DUF2442)